MLHKSLKTLAAVATVAMAPVAAEAAYISTATIEGGVIYNADGDLTLGTISNHFGINGANAPRLSGAVIDRYGRDGYHLGLVMSLTDYDINLPDVNKTARWDIEIDFELDATLGFELPSPRPGVPGPVIRRSFDYDFEESATLGVFSINQAADLIADITFEDLDELGMAFASLVGDLPPFTPLGRAGVLLLSDQLLPDPSLILLLKADPFRGGMPGGPMIGGPGQNMQIQGPGGRQPRIVGGVADFRADLTLTAVPEPASIGLLGVGLLGLGLGARRRERA